MGQPAFIARGKNQNPPKRRGIFRSARHDPRRIRAALKPLADLERLVNRVIAGQAQPRDLVAMRSTLEQLPVIKEVISRQSSVVSGQWSVCEDELFAATKRY